MIGGYIKSDTCREKLKDKREVYCRSDWYTHACMYTHTQWNTHRRQNCKSLTLNPCDSQWPMLQYMLSNFSVPGSNHAYMALKSCASGPSTSFNVSGSNQMHMVTHGSEVQWIRPQHKFQCVWTCIWWHMGQHKFHSICIKTNAYGDTWVRSSVNQVLA